MHWPPKQRAQAPAEEKLGDGNDGNRSTPVHVIELFDEKGDAIAVDETRMNPVSLKQTCGKCHTYETIAGGWHFHAGSGKSPGGRIGEPWVIADSETRTQIPVSDRGWAGTYSPAELGVSAWQFLQYFGSHYPGGAYGEAEASEDDPVAGLRGGISGKFEINCLACHNADSMQNQSDAALQAARQNYRWIATVSSGLGIVKGTASELDDLYDPWTESKINCLYDKGRFNSEDKVAFDIVRQPPANRCYFCHSTQDMDSSGDKEWTRDQDVHLAAGLTCADCHRNSANHMIYPRRSICNPRGGWVLFRPCPVAAVILAMRRPMPRPHRRAVVSEPRGLCMPGSRRFTSTSWPAPPAIPARCPPTARRWSGRPGFISSASMANMPST